MRTAIQLLASADVLAARSKKAKKVARDVGFALARVAVADPLEHDGQRLQEWLDQGRQAGMGWFTENYVESCVEPERHVTAARSVLSVGMSYWNGPRPGSNGHGKVARYAWGTDYHQVIGARLTTLTERLGAEFGGNYRWFVDAGPMLDRAWARRSGLGWIGKNTTVITPSLGSFVLLGEIITTMEMAPDAALETNCGTCHLCQTSCPTGALGADYSLDSRRCISYLTIEHRGPIPRDLRPLMGAWVFGCDICQDVCPPSVAPYLSTTDDRKQWAAAARVERANVSPSLAFGANATTPGPLFSGSTQPELDLVWLLSVSHDDYLRVFRNTAIRRAKVWMLRRNAAVALGNVGDVETVSALADALGDEHPVVRGHAAWALGRLRERLGVQIEDALNRDLLEESDSTVREEIQAALGVVPATRL